MFGVSVRNSSEFVYMVDWCKKRGYGILFIGEPTKYPIIIYVKDDSCSWGEVEKVEDWDNICSFPGFIEHEEWKILQKGPPHNMFVYG